MIAIVKIGGHQAIVESGEQIEVDKINEKEGKSVELETLLISSEDASDTQIGAPLLDIKIKAKVIEHGKSKKIRVYKMNPRKRYRRTQGHRQDYTILEIGKIGTTKKVSTKKAIETKEKAKKVEKKEVVKKKLTTKKTITKK
jgi:large subunit ribosomal protein L21